MFGNMFWLLIMFIIVLGAGAIGIWLFSLLPQSWQNWIDEFDKHH